MSGMTAGIGVIVAIRREPWKPAAPNLASSADVCILVCSAAETVAVSKNRAI